MRRALQGQCALTRYARRSTGALIVDTTRYSSSRDARSLGSTAISPSAQLARSLRPSGLGAVGEGTGQPWAHRALHDYSHLSTPGASSSRSQSIVPVPTRHHRPAASILPATSTYLLSSPTYAQQRRSFHASRRNQVHPALYFLVPLLKSSVSLGIIKTGLLRSFVFPCVC